MVNNGIVVFFLSQKVILGYFENLTVLTAKLNEETNL